ncbi:MAG: hypothetical protein AB7U76_25065 [Pirellulales bacterium]
MAIQDEIINRILNGLSEQPAQGPSFGSLAPVSAPAAQPQPAALGGPVAAPSVAPAAKSSPYMAEPSGFEDFGTFLAGLGSGNGAILPALGGGMKAVSDGKRQRDAMNQTFDLLVKKGIPEADARAMMTNPAALKLGLEQIYKKPSDKKYMQVEGRIVEIGPDGAKELYSAPPGGRESIKFGTTPYFTQDGRPYVTGSNGEIKYLDLGEGAKALAPGELANEKAKGSATGKAMGQAKADLPKIVQSTAETLGVLDQLAADPYLEKMVGVGGWTPDLSPAANRVASYMDQIGGKAFLTAFQSLKGGGQITEIEGAKATAAITRLQNRKQSVEDYKKAITDLQNIARNGLIRAKVDAGVLPPEALNQITDFEQVKDVGTKPQTNAAPPPGNHNPRGAPSSGPAQIDAGDGFTLKPIGGK